MVQQPPFLTPAQQIRASEFQRQQQEKLERERSGAPQGLLGKLGEQVSDTPIGRAAAPVIDFATRPLIPETAVAGLPTPLRVGGEALTNLTSPLGLGIAGASLLTGGTTAPLLAGEIGSSLAFEVAEEAGAPEPLQFAAGITGGVLSANPARFAKAFKVISQRKGAAGALAELNGNNTKGVANSAFQIPRATKVRDKPRNLINFEPAHRNIPDINQRIDPQAPFANPSARAMPGSEVEAVYGPVLWHASMNTSGLIKSGVIKSGQRLSDELLEVSEQNLGQALRQSGLNGIAGRSKQASLSYSRPAVMGIASQFRRNRDLMEVLDQGTFGSSFDELADLIRRWADEDIDFMDRYIRADPSYEEIFGASQDLNEFFRQSVQEINSSADRAGAALRATRERIKQQTGIKDTDPSLLQLVIQDPGSGAPVSPGLRGALEEVVNYRMSTHGLPVSSETGQALFQPDMVLLDVLQFDEAALLETADDILKRPRSEIGIIAVPTSNIDPNVLVIGDFEEITSEVAVLGDIPLNGARVISDIEKLVLSGRKTGDPLLDFAVENIRKSRR